MKRTAKHAPGSLVFDRRRGQWQYFWYESGHRRRSVAAICTQPRHRRGEQLKTGDDLLRHPRMDPRFEKSSRAF